MTYQLTIDWHKKAEERLLGRQIVALRWISTKEAEAMDWDSRPIVLELDNGTFLIPQSDDEGNNGGALWIHQDHQDEWNVMPVMGLNDVEIGQGHAEQSS